MRITNTAGSVELVVVPKVGVVVVVVGGQVAVVVVEVEVVVVGGRVVVVAVAVEVVVVVVEVVVVEVVVVDVALSAQMKMRPFSWSALVTAASPSATCVARSRQGAHISWTTILSAARL